MESPVSVNRSARTAAAFARSRTSFDHVQIAQLAGACAALAVTIRGYCAQMNGYSDDSYCKKYIYCRNFLTSDTKSAAATLARSWPKCLSTKWKRPRDLSCSKSCTQVYLWCVAPVGAQLKEATTDGTTCRA
eukprot:6213414-Pleurochrysis_carterae.AAC.6